MEMSVVSKQDAYTHVALSGRLDPESVRAKGYTFHEYTAAEGKPTLVDMSDVDFLASLGVGMLLQAAKELAVSGAKLVLVNPQQMVEGTLRSAGIVGMILIARDTEEAKRAVGVA